METSRIATHPLARRSFAKVAFSRTLGVRLKMAVLGAACVFGVALGFASAALGPRLFGPNKTIGRTVTLENFQVILQRQAEVAAEGVSAPANR
jgi:hypothetical protein